MIGIEKGKPFNPDAGTQKILSDAAREAHDCGSKVSGPLRDALQ
jgi:hypothetical protein